MSWVLTILGIVLLIVLHELGHFTVAKAVGMRVERFSLFFPPTIARIRRGETEYAIGALPLGGYVKITGMSPEEIGELEPEVSRRAYYNQAPWKRIVVILAGPCVNIAIAFLLFWAILMSGNLAGATLVYNLDPGTQAIAATTTVEAVQKGSPAAAALRRGDRILAIDGRPVQEESARRLIEADRCAGVQTSGCSGRQPLLLSVRRGGRTLSLTLVPRYSSEAKRMLIGVGFGDGAKSFGALGAAGAAIATMGHATAETLTGFVHAFTSSKVRAEVSSIVGITQAAHTTVVAGAGEALVFLGYISLVLAVINLFPFLPLDGGHILWSLAEKLRGRRISLVAMYRYSSVGIVLLLFLVINGFSNDISRLGG